MINIPFKKRYAPNIGKNMKTTVRRIALFLLFLTAFSRLARAGEADLIIPDLSGVQFLGQVNGHSILTWGILVCIIGFAFGLLQFLSIQRLAAHRSMLDISALIYETCKTYLIAQGKFIIIIEILVATILAVYFGWLRHFELTKVAVILACSVVGILGSYTVAWFGMRINTLANSRSAFWSLKGKPFPVYSIPLQAGMSIGMLLISSELLIMLCILLSIDPSYAGPCFIGFAIGESLAASVLRIAGGIFTKIADIGSDLMKIAFNIKEDDARNPGVIADCVGDNAGDSVGPTADGFETYGVTGVALISFILLAVKDPVVQVKLLVWIFVVRLVMLLASAISYWINDRVARARYFDADEMNFEKPLISLVWISSFVSIAFSYAVTYVLIPDLGDGTLWWKLASIISCGTIAGAVIPELVKIFTSVESDYARHILHSSRKGGFSLNILAGLTTGYFSAYWMGMVIILLMAVAYWLSGMGLSALMIAPPIFAFGLVAFGFLGMGPVTIAVDSYGPVADNAQSIYELSLIDKIPGIKGDIEKNFGFSPDFAKGKHHLEANDGAGNTFKATAKPVLIGTAVVGATTMIFSIIMILTEGLTVNIDKLSILYPPFFLGLLLGGAVIYWFSGASLHAVSSGAYHAVEFIQGNIRLEGGDRASVEDSKKVVEICTRFAQKGMINLFLTVFCSILAFACINAYLLIGCLISIALFGLFQAIFMANAGGAWDNTKKMVEVDLREKGTALHASTVVGDTVGDPFKDTTSVSINPIIKFATLFGLLAIELALELSRNTALTLGVIFLAASFLFAWKSFDDMLSKEHK